MLSSGIRFASQLLGKAPVRVFVAPIIVMMNDGHVHKENRTHNTVCNEIVKQEKQRPV